MSIAQKAVVSASTPKRKRIRSRKSKKRTGEVGSHETTDFSENEEEPVASTDVLKNDNIEKPKEVKRSHSIDKEEQSGEREGKTKRKRKRTRNKVTKEFSADSLNKDASFSSNLQTLPLVYRDKDLNEKTSNALEYVRQYHLNRANWKFNKAKQEFLIRHMLTPPLELSFSSHTTVDKEEMAERAEMNKEESVTTLDQYWPEEWNEYVARYFDTIQGQAKQRLIDVLKMTADQDILPIMDTSVEESTTESQTTHPSDVNTRKSVTFGDLAMTQEDSFNPTRITKGEYHRLHFQKERAKTLLAFMEQSVL